jgi:hypothetical protein
VIDTISLILSEAHLSTLLPDGTREPCAGAEEPKGEGVGEHDADGNGGVVERLRVDRVELWETKDDRDERNPENGHNRDRVREHAKVEWPAHEFVRIYHAQCDGDA